MQENNSGIGEKEKIVEIEIERLREFRGHPFKVRQDEQMDMLMESIKKYGIHLYRFITNSVMNKIKLSQNAGHMGLFYSPAFWESFTIWN